MKYNLSAVALLAALALAGCSKEGVAPESTLPTDGVIQVKASVGQASTRTGMTTTGLTEFSLTVGNVKNSRLTLNDGTWSWSKQALWDKQNPAVMFYAYAPYTNEATDNSNFWFSIAADQRDGAASSDLLYATGEVDPTAAQDTSRDIYYDTKSKAVVIKMNHRLSKMTINLKYGDELTQEGAIPTLDSVKLCGTIPSCIFYIQSGAIQLPLSSMTRDITMCRLKEATEGYDATIEAIVMPQTSSFTVRLYLNGNNDNFVYTNSSYAFSSGQSNTLGLIVGKDVTAMGEISAEPWKSGNNMSMETE